ncbi:hypothetical protein QLS71_000815 [Mariniflexile litorale]|uniref:Holin-X, holin superfamily III n=1 Tax=Mariniflexile litorale TaxID=3045158 RepID=A0AAU7EGL1_9FLAO|nr:hypothetical protein [Mariniflexile sp. KMM 9835]MDQ8211915.1 hypothetical protein [Mariniflexile sp. KMM 9835]
METIAANIELLYEKAKNYAEINAELVKLYAIDKAADVVSSIFARLVIIVGVAMVFLFVNISLSLFLGDLLGEDYFGFLVVSGIYLIVTVILNYNRDKIIKVPITNLIIAKLLKSKSASNNSKTSQDGIL